MGSPNREAEDSVGVSEIGVLLSDQGNGIDIRTLRFAYGDDMKSAEIRVDGSEQRLHFEIRNGRLCLHAHRANGTREFVTEFSL